jgi:pilus assembly protein CpaC
MRTNNNQIVKHAVSLTVALMGVAATATYAAEPAKQPTQMASFTPAVQPTLGLVETGVDASGKIEINVNKTTVVTTRDKVKRFSVGQPDIAEVTAVGPSTLLVTAKKAGTTQIIVWNEQEQSQVIDVNVTVDIQALRDEFKKMFPDAPLTVDMINGVVSLKGRVPSLKVAEQAEQVARAYAKEVLNFLEIGGGQQIVLQVQFVEMSRSASNELGFRSFFDDGHGAFGTMNGPGGSPIGGLINGNGSIPEGTGISLFGTGNIGGMAFEAFLDAMKKNNLARTLAEPNLVAVSGEDASFLAGGEVPIPVPQSGSGGAATITIQYKEFGVRLKYNAVVLGDGRIRLKAEPEVSELDYSNGTSISGQTVPGIRTRKVSSVVELAEGQTLALAGLLQRRVDAKNEATPVLGELPIVGAFFRNVAYTRQETELVILVTPKLASAMNPDQIPALPGADWRYPNEAQLYGFADLGGPAGEGRDGKSDSRKETAPPRFVGPNGFDDGTVQPAVAKTDTK